MLCATSQRALLWLSECVAEPEDRALLDRLRAGPAAVNVLASDFEASRPAISKHLLVLKRARLVDEQRAGRERVYRLQPQPLLLVGELLGADALDRAAISQ
mgnify:CR=1 FL=1